MGLALLLRFVIIFYIAKLVWSLITGKKAVKQEKSHKQKKKMERFDANGKSVSDGDFEEIK